MALNGLIFKTGSRFASVPGLVAWVTRQGLTIVPVSGKDQIRGINSFTDNSLRYDIGYNLTNTYPPVLNNGFLDFDFDLYTDDAAITSSNFEVMKFLHEGKNFGMYEIMAMDWTGTSGQGTGFETTTGTGEGVRVLYDNNNGYYDVGFIDVNGGASSQTDFNSTQITKGVFNNVGIVRDSLNTANNLKLYVNGILEESESVTFAHAANNPPRHQFSKVNSAGRRQVYAERVIYNWDGYTESEIAGFNTTVQTILESIRVSLPALPARLTP